jgi:hypothetical protein
MAPIVSGTGRPLVPIGNPIANSSMEIPKPAKAAVRRVANVSFSASSFLEHVDRHAEQNDSADNDCGRLEPRPHEATDQQTDERHYGFEEGEGRRRAKRAHAAQPEQHRHGESVEPERDYKGGDLEKHGPSEGGASQSGRTLALSMYCRRSRNCGAAGAAMARFYRIEVGRLFAPPLLLAVFSCSSCLASRRRGNSRTE